MKHRANDARDGLSSYSNRRDQSGLNGCCTAMWKANGKTTTLSLFLDSLFPKTETEEKIKGQIEVTRRRGRRRKKLLDDLKDRRGYCQLKEEGLDRTMWRNRFGRDLDLSFVRLVMMMMMMMMFVLCTTTMTGHLELILPYFFRPFQVHARIKLCKEPRQFPPPATSTFLTSHKLCV